MLRLKQQLKVKTLALPTLLLLLLLLLLLMLLMYPDYCPFNATAAF